MVDEKENTYSQGGDPARGTELIELGARFN